jgi:hypothetical protein
MSGGADRLHRRVLWMLHEAADVLMDEKVVERVRTDPKRMEARARILAGNLSLAEVDERCPDPGPSLHGEADQRAALAHLAQRRARQIALASWAARRIDLPLNEHGLVGCAVRVLPGSRAWQQAMAALPALLRQEADRGDRTALRLLREVGRATWEEDGLTGREPASPAGQERRGRVPHGSAG